MTFFSSLNVSYAATYVFLKAELLTLNFSSQMFVNKHFQTLNCKKKGQKYLTFFKLKLTGLFSLSISLILDGRAVFKDAQIREIILIFQDLELHCTALHWTEFKLNL